MTRHLARLLAVPVSTGLTRHGWGESVASQQPGVLLLYSSSWFKITATSHEASVLKWRKGYIGYLTRGIGHNRNILKARQTNNNKNYKIKKGIQKGLILTYMWGRFDTWGGTLIPWFLRRSIWSCQLTSALFGVGSSWYIFWTYAAFYAGTL